MKIMTSAWARPNNKVNHHLYLSNGDMPSVCIDIHSIDFNAINRMFNLTHDPTLDKQILGRSCIYFTNDK